VIVTSPPAPPPLAGRRDNASSRVAGEASAAGPVAEGDSVGAGGEGVHGVSGCITEGDCVVYWLEAALTMSLTPSPTMIVVISGSSNDQLSKPLPQGQFRLAKISSWRVDQVNLVAP
jgi:hypothetical protein